MKPSILYFAAFFMVLNSCKSGGADKAATVALKNSMKTTAHLLSLETRVKVNAMQNRLNSPYMRIKAGIWFPKVLVIDSVTAIFIKAVEQNLQKANDADLGSKIDDYRKDLLGIEPRISIEFNEIIMAFPNSRIDSGKGFKDIKTSELSEDMREIYLSNIIQQALVLENKLLIFCLDNCPDNYDGYSTFSAIVGQNSSVVEPSGQISIMAGVGSFSRSAQPVFTINGELVPPEPDAVAYYTMKAPSKPGKYKVPVVIEYTDQDGKKQKMSKKVEYEVRY